MMKGETNGVRLRRLEEGKSRGLYKDGMPEHEREKRQMIWKGGSLWVPKKGVEKM